MDVNTKMLTFDTIEELEEHMKAFPSEPRLVIDVFKNEDGTYCLQWQEQKYYIAQDGIKYPDEVWLTKEGKMIQIQDIEAEHLRNILRMIIRKNRSIVEQLNNTMMKYSSDMEGDDEFFDEKLPPPGSVTYH